MLALLAALALTQLEPGMTDSESQWTGRHRLHLTCVPLRTEPDQDLLPVGLEACKPVRGGCGRHDPRLRWRDDFRAEALASVFEL